MDRSESVVMNYMPSNATIITTYKCTAQCQDCCFNCSPKETNKLSLDDIRKFIDEINSLHSIKNLVWTGGECTLLSEDLYSGLEYAHEKGIYSRLVTNASWSKNIKKNIENIKRLNAVGVTEINISTGDNHLKYISIKKVLNAVIACLETKTRILVSIEKTKNSKFTKDMFEMHPLYNLIDNHPNKHLLTVITPNWISFSDNGNYKYDKEAFIEARNGCNQIYNFVGIDPNKNIISCCGLTLKYMPEMILDNINDNSVLDMVQQQKRDFMKQWLFVDGAINILQKVGEWNSNLVFPKFIHPCQACAYIFQTEEIVNTINENYSSIINDVTQRFYEKLSFDRLLSEKLNIMSQGDQNG